MTQFHFYLVSDATGETLKTIARAATVQFEGAEPIEHFWSLVHTPTQMAEVIAKIEEEPGVVLYTLVSRDLRDMLEEACRRLQVPSVAVLDPVISVLSNFLGAEISELPGGQHAMDAEYFNRIEAMHFAMSHDDGQLLGELRMADVILVGVSRTSKTPTCIYLANRGIKAGNVPIVPGMELPPELEGVEGPLIVGLTASPKRVVEIRRNRLLSLRQDSETDYVDLDAVKDELTTARKLFGRYQWPVIDVTRRSIEETAAAILNLYARRAGA
jgi:regulator of PEP synthase PpsR (kinase-PPPase family)